MNLVQYILQNLSQVILRSIPPHTENHYSRYRTTHLLLKSETAPLWIFGIRITAKMNIEFAINSSPVSYTHLTLPTTGSLCRSRWSPYH